MKQQHDERPRPLDVLLLGDSLIEHWHGTDLGYPNPKFDDCPAVYRELFRLETSPVAGLAAGIGGDRAPQLLYRVQNGEVPTASAAADNGDDAVWWEHGPAVLWLQVGTNDVGGDHCAAESVAASIIAVVEQLLRQHHAAAAAAAASQHENSRSTSSSSFLKRIVINSILPRGGYHQTNDLWPAHGWQVLRRVNQQLECYAQDRASRAAAPNRTADSSTQHRPPPLVEFVNTTHLFVSKAHPTRRNTALYDADGLHLNAAGYRVWGRFIVTKVKEILAEQETAAASVVHDDNHDNDDDDKSDATSSSSTAENDATGAASSSSSSSSSTSTAHQHDKPAPPRPKNCPENHDWDNFLQTEAARPQEELCHSANPHPVCKCFKPGTAVRQDAKMLQRRWNYTEQRNLDLVQQQVDSRPLDVVLLGDSITEHWLGTDLGSPLFPAVKAVYQELFQRGNNSADHDDDNVDDKDRNKAISGLALGIGGDRCSHLLYRLRHGELADNIHPPVFWLLIGTNDIASHCKSDTIAAGNIAIVKEILFHRPKAKIVINSILPRDRLWKDHSWRVASEVNHMLECFAASSDRLEFFNATDLFTVVVDISHQQQHNEETVVVRRNEKYYGDRVHPSAAGYRVWGREIVAKVRELIA